MRTTLLSSLLCLCAAAAHGSVTYTLNLNANPGSTYSGTGGITLATAPSATGLTTYSAGQYSNLFFTIDGQTFSQATGGTVSAVQFLNGQVYDITFSQQIGTSPNRFSLQTTSVFNFAYNNLQSSSTGTLTSALASTTAPVSVTPEPSSFALLLTGMAGVGGVLRKRYL